MTYDPDHSQEPWTDAEVLGCRFGTPSPVAIGSHVHYRHEDHGDVTDALVLDVDNDFPEMVLVNDVAVKIKPWPTLTLDTVHGRVKTREARVRGSAGWLPLNWHTP